MMKPLALGLFAAVIAAFWTVKVASEPAVIAQPTGGVRENRVPDGKSTDTFSPIAAVLRHPRCLNCHPRDDRPRQSDDRHIHRQNVVRGVDGMGFVNARCNSCHRVENNDYSGVPGAPLWHLAPLSMGWQGLNDAELCTTLKDEKKNGGKTVAELVEHMTKDDLVLWGWKPGGDRAPVSTPHDQFVKELETWASAGAPCPTSPSAN